MCENKLNCFLPKVLMRWWYLRPICFVNVILNYVTGEGGFMGKGGVMLISVNSLSSCGFLLCFCPMQEKETSSASLFFVVAKSAGSNRCVQSRTTVMNPNCCLSKNSTGQWHTLVKVAQRLFSTGFFLFSDDSLPLWRWISINVSKLLYRHRAERFLFNFFLFPQ